ncbi:TPA: hypothetical protein N0F65_007087 [Lagenidium giganteum]|uniref:Malectin-like domain-containing protein n=1 Tax=Lagenidium giganteum TaxID=4803 RepID=A0AAV2YRH4_9STRA|nr:TPA: hypothetical protein N0F65_007087 [Lagenidium giganteum]
MVAPTPGRTRTTMSASAVVRRRLKNEQLQARPQRTLEFPSRPKDQYVAWIEHDDNSEKDAAKPVTVCVLWLRHVDTEDQWQCIIENPGYHARFDDDATDWEAAQRAAQALSHYELMTMLEVAMMDRSEEPVLEERAPVLDLVASTPYHMTLCLLWWAEEPQSQSEVNSPRRFEFAMYKTVPAPRQDAAESERTAAASAASKALARVRSILPVKSSWTMRGLPRRGLEAPEPEVVLEDRFVHPNATNTISFGISLIFLSLQSIENISHFEYFNWGRMVGKDDAPYFNVIADGVNFLQRGLYQVDLDVFYLEAQQTSNPYRVFIAGKSLENLLEIHFYKPVNPKVPIRRASSRMVLLFEPNEDLKIQFLKHTFALTSSRMTIHKLDS